MDVVAGTAGHIDHGKTALIKALTGVDADRLPEEKERGITIDLGFAEMEIADIRFGFVDVPGHERFVKNMLAGASGIDLVLLIVAADEGVMPQTREHFEICRLLGTLAGMIVLTKRDLVDEETLVLAKQEVAELVAGSFLDAAPVIAVSSKTGDGIDELRATLADAARKLPARDQALVTRLPVDRSFSVKGFGTVITGTLASGEISEADELEILPDKRPVRVRGLQTYGHSTKTVHAGQRTAVNLGGVDRGDVGRGMILAEKDALSPTQIVDVRLEVLSESKKPLRSRQRVRLHIGTAEVLCRLSILNDTNEIVQGQSDFAQLRLEMPVSAVPGERFVIRSYSPQVTIAGGTIIDAVAQKHKRKDVPEAKTFLNSLEVSKDSVSRSRLFVERAGESGASFSDLQAAMGFRKELISEGLEENVRLNAVVKTGNYYLSKASFESLKAKAIAEIKRHHAREPISKGMPRETLKERVFSFTAPEIFKGVLASLESERKTRTDHELVSSADHRAKLSDEETKVLERLRAMYGGDGLEAPKLEEGLLEASRMTRLNREAARKVFQLLISAGDVVKITDDLYVSGKALTNLQRRLSAHAAATSDRLVDVPKFKEIAGVSRKYAIPLLEYFDREKITLRKGDKRLIL
jgi:selenocysteine-specific elongation factor